MSVQSTFGYVINRLKTDNDDDFGDDKEKEGEECSLVCILLCISPASDYGLPTFRNPLSVPSS